jgi:hypothetical protein
MMITTKKKMGKTPYNCLVTAIDSLMTTRPYILLIAARTLTIRDVCWVV